MNIGGAGSYVYDTPANSNTTSVDSAPKAEEKRVYAPKMPSKGEWQSCVKCTYAHRLFLFFSPGGFWCFQQAVVGQKQKLLLLTQWYQHRYPKTSWDMRGVFSDVLDKDFLGHVLCQQEQNNVFLTDQSLLSSFHYCFPPSKLIAFFPYVHHFSCVYA